MFTTYSYEPLRQSFCLCTESVETISSCLQTLPTKKATGCDNMHAYLIKEAAPVIVYFLTSVINHSIVIGKVPKQWKQARVTSVHKGGDITIMNNYRPISTLPVYPKAPYWGNFCSQCMFETFPNKPAFVKLANLLMTLPYIQ